MIGFCMGGGFALMLAPGHGFSAASVNYGGLTEDTERALPEACPIIASYGARDRWPGVRKVPDRLEPALAKAGIEHDITRYPDAGPGFLNDHDPAELPLWVKAIAKLSAAGYNEPSIRDARRRIVDFFDAHLKHDEIEIEPLEGDYRGHEGVRRWWSNLLDCLPDYTAEVEQLQDLGDMTLGRIRGAGQGAASTTPVVETWWQSIRWRDGTCIWSRNFATEAKALEAIQLETRRLRT